MAYWHAVGSHDVVTKNCHVSPSAPICLILNKFSINNLKQSPVLTGCSRVRRHMFSC